MSRDDATIIDILKAARLSQEFVHGMSEEEFFNDQKTQSAVLHQLLVLGEAAKHLTKNFRDQHPEIPWQQITGMRDVLIHHYDAVDLDQVWKTLDADIAPLITFLEPHSPQPPQS